MTTTATLASYACNRRPFVVHHRHINNNNNNYSVFTRKVNSNFFNLLLNHSIKLLSLIIITLIGKQHFSIETNLFNFKAVNCQQLQQLQTTTQYVQHNNIIYFDVSEGLPNNTYVGNIKSSDGQIPYLIVPWAPTPESERIQAFRVDLLNGDLYTNSVLDREHRELYHFIAIVKDPFWEIKCTVTVKDINDNAPMFLLGSNLQQQQLQQASSLLLSTTAAAVTQNNLFVSNNETTFVIELPEGQRGVRKVLPIAIDLDSPQYGIKEFRIVSGNTPSGTFQLVEHEAPARSSLAASLAQAGFSSLDDPTSSLSAVDNPRIQEQLNAQAVVLIPSQPQNSNNQQQQLLLSQQQQQLQQFSSSNTFMQPAIQQHQQQQQLSHQPQSSRYLIDVEVSQYLDRENQSSYQLVVEAIDGGQPPLIGRLLVTVNVQDANDNDPIFTKKVYECYVQENASKNTPLLKVQAFDADIDLNAQISYSIVKRTSSQNNNTNSNNNSTQAQQQRARATSSTSSTSAPSTPTSNGIRSFSSLQQQQQSASAELFDIDPIKGEIYLINALDYEQAEMHEFFVEARDHGKPSRSSLALVKVFVNDVNDDPPPIQQALNPYNRSSMSYPNGANSNSKSPTGSNQQIPPQALNGGADYITRQPSASSLDESSKLYQPTSFMQTTFTNIASWFSQIPSIGIFSIVFISFVLLSGSFCFIKVRSSRKSIEQDHYNDTAGLTLSPNGEQLKQSPNHSLSNHHHTPPDHHHHHHHHSLERHSHSHLPLSLHQSHAGTPQHNSLDHHHYHNHSPASLMGGHLHHHQPGLGGAGEHHHQMNHSLGHHHQHQQQQEQHHLHLNSNSLKHNNHSPSLHHLALGNGANAGSTIQSSHHHHSLEHHLHPSSLHRQSVAQYHSLEHHHSASLKHNHLSQNQSGSGAGQLQQGQTALQRYHSHYPHIHHHPAAVAQQQHSSPFQQQQLQHHHHLHQQQQQQHQSSLQTLQQSQQQHSREQVRHHSTSGCGGSGRGGQLPATPNSTHNSQSLTQSHTWLIGLAYAQDWCGSYNWDYLTDWTPQYQTLMDLMK